MWKGLIPEFQYSRQSDVRAHLSVNEFQELALRGKSPVTFFCFNIDTFFALLTFADFHLFFSILGKPKRIPILKRRTLRWSPNE